MITHARAAGLAAALTLIAAPRGEAQDSSLRLTIAGGPHDGTYDTTPGDGGPDGWAVTADFRATSGKRVVYEIYAMPPELQGPGRKEPQKGSGTVTIKQEDAGTSATFRGQTQDGVRMEGSVRCDRRRSK